MSLQHGLAVLQGYSQANMTTRAMASVRWGSDYLLKMIGQGVNGSELIYQVRKLQAGGVVQCWPAAISQDSTIWQEADDSRSRLQL